MDICQVIFAKWKTGSDARSNYFVETFFHSSQYKSNGGWLLGQWAEKMGPYFKISKGPKVSLLDSVYNQAFFRASPQARGQQFRFSMNWIQSIDNTVQLRSNFAVYEQVG